MEGSSMLGIQPLAFGRGLIPEQRVDIEPRVRDIENQLYVFLLVLVLSTLEKQ